MLHDIFNENKREKFLTCAKWKCMPEGVTAIASAPYHDNRRSQDFNVMGPLRNRVWDSLLRQSKDLQRKLCPFFLKKQIFGVKM